MLVFEIKPDAVDVKEDILSALPNSNVTSVDSLDGNDFLQILVPLVSVIMPIISQILQKYFDDNRVTIKYDGVEISALGYDKAMNILKEVLAHRDNSKKE